MLLSCLCTKQMAQTSKCNHTCILVCLLLPLAPDELPLQLQQFQEIQQLQGLVPLTALVGHQFPLNKHSNPSARSKSGH